MDSSAFSGILLGTGILILALAIGQVPVATLLNPEAILIVFGGTLSATLVSFNRQRIMRAFAALLHNSPESRIRPTECQQHIMDVVAFVRDEGILALEPLLGTVDLPFFKKGLALVVDNRSEKFIRDSLTTEIEVAYREAVEDAKVFETAGGYSPTMGIIGAVIGLIFVVRAFRNPAELGQGVAAAFSATLFGVALSNLFLLPLGARLRQRARDEFFIKTMLLEAVLGIRAADHPMLIAEKLDAYVTRPSTGLRATGNAPVLSGGGRPSVLDDDFLQVPSI